jgi:hypothetical protein
MTRNALPLSSSTTRMRRHRDRAKHGSIFVRFEMIPIAVDRLIALSWLNSESRRDPETGEITEAPVVVPVEGNIQIAPKASKPRPMPKSAQIALRALHKAVDETGAVPPASNHIPSGVRVVVGLNAWRQYAYSMGISSGEDRAKQKAFKTAYDHLLAGRHIGVWNEQAWPT